MPAEFRRDRLPIAPDVVRRHRPSFHIPPVRHGCSCPTTRNKLLTPARGGRPVRAGQGVGVICSGSRSRSIAGFGFRNQARFIARTVLILDRVAHLRPDAGARMHSPPASNKFRKSARLSAPGNRQAMRMIATCGPNGERSGEGMRFFATTAKPAGILRRHALSMSLVIQYSTSFAGMRARRNRIVSNNRVSCKTLWATGFFARFGDVS